uniref:Ctr_10_TN conopeptide n=2 Tax=Conus tribblei TaxID=101761 RepID=A0A0C9SEL4_CONTD
MHLSLARSAVLMLLLLFALGTFVGVQPGQISDVDNGQLTDNRRNLQSLRKPMTLFKSLKKRVSCGDTCSSSSQCPSSCPYCTSNTSICM